MIYNIDNDDIPDSFHPVIRKWFIETLGKPTPVQAQAWPLIESGENVLALAPTGSGKTLTAFLSAISRFCTDKVTQKSYTQTRTAQDISTIYPADKLSVLYISPLKALNEDIKRNLLEPLAAIKTRFEKEGLIFPSIRVQTRSGDTPQSERRRFFIHPPSILALTPESLSILLLNPKGRQVLSNVKYVIIDEIHSVLGNKRGAFMSCQIDRLALIAGNFQRISLSATVRNPQTAAEFVAGFGRTVQIVSPVSEKKIEFNVEYPDISLVSGGDLPANIRDELSPSGRQISRYAPLINYVLNRIFEGLTLLVFAESRRRSERLCYFINQAASEKFKSGAKWETDSGINSRFSNGVVAYPHHGSLSKEIRRTIEKGFAEGNISCVVATSSLELGIDIGYVDEVVLAGSTGYVSGALQRIGRSGHSVGKTSIGKLFAFHGTDLLIAAALKDAVEERDIEEIHPIENPLDILSQLILCLCSEKDRNIDELYEVIKKFYIFKNLGYDSYYRVIRMLAGLTTGNKTDKKNIDENKRIREIKPRIWLEKSEGKIGVIDGTTTLLYTSGGVIANRGLYSLRLSDGTKIGELDEEFVWERRIGDVFDFGARGWRIKNISSEAVEVSPLEYRADFIPFWKADVNFRSKNLTQRILSLLEEFNKSGNIKTNLNSCAYESLKTFLLSQRSMQNDLPLADINNVTVEIIKGIELNRDFLTVIIHNFRGGQINYPLSLALSAEIEEIMGLRIESFPSDDNILFLLPRSGLETVSLTPQEIIQNSFKSLERQETSALIRGERLFRNRLESSALFGANFREAAERSLLIPKSPFGKRTPLWIMRQRSKRLFDAVADDEGFPAAAEAWRSCLIDNLDMDGFRDFIFAVNSGVISLSFFNTIIPSVFSANIVRQETNSFMYEYDERKDLAGKSHSASISDKVIEEAIGKSDLRPCLKISIINDFTSRLRREITGWAPDDSLSLSEWIKERIAIPQDEWEILCSVMPQNVINNIDKNKIKTIKRSGAQIPSVIHYEWEENWINEPIALLGQWLRYESVISIERICAIFGVSLTEAEDAVNALIEVDEVVRDIKIESQQADLLAAPNSSLLVCDRENLEMLLRLSRKKQRPSIKEYPSSMLTSFLAIRQGLTEKNSESLNKSLYGWCAPAKLWETEILYARNSSYDPEKINTALHEGKLIWYGAGKERIIFCHPEDLELVIESPDPKKRKPVKSKNEIEKTENKNDESDISSLLSSSFFNRPRDFWEIKNELGLDINSCVKIIWKEVWNGSLTADSFDPVRKGIIDGFVPKSDFLSIDSAISKENKMPHSAANLRFSGRYPRIPGALRNRWRTGAPIQGNWFSLLTEEDQYDNKHSVNPLEEDAINRDRVRLLLNRWGILCRQFLEHEEPVFSWSKLIPVMRRMELAGELVTGRFFTGVNSLQFASPSIAAELEKAENYDALYWMNAADPASLAGLDIEGLPYKLCARNSNNRLYYKGANLIAISEKNCKELIIIAEPDDPVIPKFIDLLKLLRTRKIMPLNKILIEKINEQDAADSCYTQYFKLQSFVIDRGRLVFW